MCSISGVYHLNPIIAKENAKMDDASAQQVVALSQIADKYLVTNRDIIAKLVKLLIAKAHFVWGKCLSGFTVSCEHQCYILPRYYLKEIDLAKFTVTLIHKISKLAINCAISKNETLNGLNISFVLSVPGPYVLSIQREGHEISGCPIKIYCSND